MLILNKTILSDTSTFCVWMKIVFSNIKKILFIVLAALGSFFSFLFLKIKYGFDNAYSFLYPKLANKKKRIQQIILILNLLVSIILVVFYFVQDIFYYRCLVYLTIFDASSVALYYLLRIYHFFFGQLSLASIEEQRSRLYIKTMFPNIGMWCGFTGAGKDEADKGVITVKREGFIEDIMKRMDEIKNICYLFDFPKVDDAVEKHTELFFSSSETTTKNNFLKLCKHYNFFFKKCYSNLDQNAFLADAAAAKKNKINHESIFIFSKGGINREHFFDMLYQYVMLYVRLNIENNFVFSNQPFVEDLSSGSTSKKFSLNFLITKELENAKLSFENEFGKKEMKEYEQKILFPFKDYLIIDETEAGTWYNNVDGNVKSEMNKLGVRSFKAFNRHNFPHFCWYMIDQDGDRTYKELEELNHAYMRIANRTIIDGGLKKNILLNIKLNYLNWRIAASGSNLDKENRKRLKRKMKIATLQQLYIASSNNKYKNMITKLQKLNFKLPSKHAEKLQIKKKQLLEKIEQNKYEGGYIVKTIVISKQISYASELAKNPYSPKDILLHPELENSTYAVKLYQKKSDCWRYDTHYMKAAKECRARRSELNLNDVENWSSSLTMNSADIWYMGYDSGFNMFGLTPEQKVLSRFKEKKKEL